MIHVKKIDIVVLLVFLGIISTWLSYYYQVEVDRISDLYLNGEPANLYAVVHHGYPLPWAVTTDPIPLESMGSEGMTHRGLVIGLRYIFVNLFLDLLFFTGIYSAILLAVIVYRRTQISSKMKQNATNGNSLQITKLLVL